MGRLPVDNSLAVRDAAALGLGIAPLPVVVAVEAFDGLRGETRAA